MDLGEVWCKYTDLPFVFAIFAVREEFCRDNAEVVTAIHQEFLTCKGEGRQDLESICLRVAPRIPMHPDECYVYLRAIEYGLGDRKRLALEKFYNYLIERGEGSSLAVPLQFF